jgi:hypothetical protein
MRILVSGRMELDYDIMYGYLNYVLLYTFVHVYVQCMPEIPTPLENATPLSNFPTST